MFAWLRQRHPLPLWLVGTSRGTQSAAWAAATLPAPNGPDGVVLTSSILSDKRSRPLPDMPLERIRMPVLVLHHEQDGCAHCNPADLPRLMAALSGSPRKTLLMVRGGQDEGDPCAARAHHGFLGQDDEVVRLISDWVLATPSAAWQNRRARGLVASGQAN